MADESQVASVDVKLHSGSHKRSSSSDAVFGLLVLTWLAVLPPVAVLLWKLVFS